MCSSDLPFGYAVLTDPGPPTITVGQQAVSSPPIQVNGVWTAQYTIQTIPLVEADYTNAAQKLLNTTAQTQGYDGILSLASYVGSTNPVFKAEALAGSAWRDAVWTEGYSILAQVKAGLLAQPTITSFLAMLPQMVWPT